MKKLIYFSLIPLCLWSIQFCKSYPTNKLNALQEYHKITEPGVQTGGVKMVPIHTPNGDFKVWTKTIGNNPKIKVLLLHGGPACTHEYWECAESFFPKEGIEFILYDQLGSFRSDQPSDSALWTTERFVEEVDQVRKALGLNKDNFYLVGHSWGGILAIDYALKYQQHLKGLVISNMMADCKAYDRYANEVLANQMDITILDSIKLLEAQGKYSDPRYMGLLTPHFYHQHICRLEEWPDAVNRTFAHTNGTIYTLMQGPSEFGISGRLENWDRSKELSKITVPTLTIGARYDTMDPKYMEWMSTQFPKGKFLLCPNGSHMSMWDDQLTYFTGLIKFIKDVDKGI